MGLIKFLYIVLIIYLIFRLLGRYVLPYFVKRYVNKAKEDFYTKQKQYNNQYQDQNKQEGEVNIKYNSNQNKKSDKDLGDYVDFEEIDDDKQDK